MKIYTLRAVQLLPISIQDAWDFFSTPVNLALITPPAMNLRTTCDIPERIYPGTIITYRVTIFPGATTSWVTEISHMNEPYYFVDEQRFGPYSFWHHKHFFRETGGGVEMEDIVHYGLPFGPLGRIVHPWLVRRKLDGVFSYRREVLVRRFGDYVEGQ